MLLSHPRPSLKEETKPESILSSPTELSPKSTNTNLVWEYLKTGSHWVPAAELGGLKAADDVLQGGSHHKVLLLQAQLLPLEKLQKQNSSSTNPDTGAATGPERPPGDPGWGIRLRDGGVLPQGLQRYVCCVCVYKRRALKIKK